MTRRWKATVQVGLFVLSMTAVVPPAPAACEKCAGALPNRYCREDASGWEGCSTDYFGNCINGSTACGGGGGNPCFPNPCDPTGALEPLRERQGLPDSVKGSNGRCEGTSSILELLIIEA